MPASRPTPHPRGFLARTRPSGASGLAQAAPAPGAACPCVLSQACLQSRPVAAWGGASVFSLLDAVLLRECSSAWFLCGPTGPRLSRFQPQHASTLLAVPCSSHLLPAVVSSLLRARRVLPRPLQPLRQVWRPGPSSSRGASGFLGPGCCGLSCPSVSPGTVWSLLSTRTQEDASEGREGKEAEPGSPRRCYIILISFGRRSARQPREALEVGLDSHPAPHPHPRPSAGSGCRSET